MQFTEIKIKLNTADLETASAIANMAAPYGIYVEDYSDLREGVEQIAHVDLIDEDLLKKDKNTAFIHLYLSECDNPAEASAYIRERLAAAGVSAEIVSASVDDSEWNENWKKYFKPLEIGRRLAVCPSWERYENPENRKG